MPDASRSRNGSSRQLSEMRNETRADERKETLNVQTLNARNAELISRSMMRIRPVDIMHGSHAHAHDTT